MHTHYASDQHEKLQKILRTALERILTLKRIPQGLYSKPIRSMFFSSLESAVHCLRILRFLTLETLELSIGLTARRAASKLLAAQTLALHQAS